MRHGSWRPIGHEEIHRDQMGQPDFALFVAHSEIIPAAIIEIAHAADEYAIAVDDCSWHHRHLRLPMTVM